MNTPSEDKSLQRDPMDPSTKSMGRDAAPMPDGTTSGSSGRRPEPRAKEEGVLDDPSGGAKAGASKRSGPGRGRKNLQLAADDAKSEDAKPARARRTKGVAVKQKTEQEELVGKPRRGPGKKAAAKADPPPLAPLAATGIPPITPGAIDFLGKPDATVADVIKLGPDSLEFVRYHLKRMQQLEADSQEAGAYWDANTRPVSPALRQFADALAKRSKQDGSDMGVKERPEMPHPAVKQADAPVLAYGQRLTSIPAYAPFTMQFRRVEPASSVTGLQEQAGDASPGDQKRTHRVLGTAQILVSAPISGLTPKSAADLGASDIKEVRAIKNAATRSLPLDAMFESGLAQPRYQADLTRQAPGLARDAHEAHKARKADWDLAHEASSTLGNFADSQEPMAKEATMELARKTIEAIRAIKIQTYREQVLAINHQVGLWHPQYKAEFQRQSPDLAVAGEVAYKAEEAKSRSSSILQESENSIERSPVQLVTEALDARPGPRAELAQMSSTSRTSAEPPAESASLDQPSTPGAVKRPGLGRRLMHGFLDAARSSSRVAAEFSAWVSRGKEPAESAEDRPDAMPDSVARKFLKVEREYYFPDRTPAFSDRGNKLSTRGANPEVVRSLIEIAKARGWEAITVGGAEEFRRSAWLEASRNGLLVTGYKPKDLDLAILAKSPADNTVEKGSSQDRDFSPTEASNQVLTGRDHPTKPATSAAPQDILRKVGQPDSEFAAKAKAFQENKPAFVVKKYPDLAAAYGVVAAAKAFAADKLPEPAREEFIEMAKRHMVEKISRGEQIHGPKIYLTPAKANALDHQAQSASKGAQKNAPQAANVLEKER